MKKPVIMLLSVFLLLIFSETPAIIPVSGVAFSPEKNQLVLLTNISAEKFYYREGYPEEFKVEYTQTIIDVGLGMRYRFNERFSSGMDFWIGVSEIGTTFSSHIQLQKRKNLILSPGLHAGLTINREYFITGLNLLVAPELLIGVKENLFLGLRYNYHYTPEVGHNLYHQHQLDLFMGVDKLRIFKFIPFVVFSITSWDTIFLGVAFGNRLLE